MSKNDEIVLRANFDGWKARAEGLQGTDPWLHYCVEQFVKPYMLDDEEIQYGITDGGGDGGTDAIYFIVNQSLLVEEDTELDPKNVSRIRIIFIQVKTSGGFKPTEIEKLIQTTDDFFDLSKAPDSFGTRYNDDIIRIMKIWKGQYIRVSGQFPEIFIDYYYITGDDASPDDYARDAGERVKAQAALHTTATCEFHYIGAQQLWNQVQRRPPQAKTLKWSETPMGAQEGTVGLVGLKDYYNFLQDEPGVLAERIFESNVRGYQRDASVNEQIQLSLEADPTETNFWLLNNGITIITPKAVPAGHLQLSIQDPQIVNGLQTSREIFNHFSKSVGREDDRSVLVRVIETGDINVQDKIINATNSQNRMMPSQLRMTDQIHRNIEALFTNVGLFYDRRKGFYKDQGKPIRKIISVTAATQAAISILLQRPNDARARPGDYFKNDDRYKSVFGENRFPLPAYLVCIQIIKCVEQFLQREEVERRDAKNLKFYIGALVSRELTQMFHPPAEKLINIDNAASIDDEIIEACYQTVLNQYEVLAEMADRDTVARGTELLTRLNAQSKEHFQE